MFSNFVYPAQVFIYCTIVQLFIYIFMQLFVLAGFYTDIKDAIKRKRFDQFIPYSILILFAIIIKVMIFVGIITTLHNSNATDLANVVGIVYPIILTICVFALGVYQLYLTYITDDLEIQLTLNKYIQDYTFGGKKFNVYDTDASAQDKERVKDAYEDWMKKSNFGGIYKFENWYNSKINANTSKTLVSDMSFVTKFNAWYDTTSKLDTSFQEIYIPETDSDLKNKYIKLTDGSYVNLTNSDTNKNIETDDARNARQYYAKLKKTVNIKDETYLKDTKARYKASPYTNMQGYSNIEGYSGVQGFSNYV